ncbi:MAG: NTP transferase domain-containing protein [Thermoprotei archaeon]|jgi:adenosylcobinamide-phosphate guanylyltransferase
MIKIKALIMAGGKATRMNNIEKPLIKICGTTMIERILNALKNTKCIEDVYITTSKNTKNTEILLKTLGYKTITTSGEDYVEDLKNTIIKLNIKDPILVLPSDLPLITPNTIEQLINIYIQNNSPPTMTFYIPLQLLKTKIRTNYIEQINNIKVIPSGISIIKGSYITQNVIPQINIIVENTELSVNVNTLLDIKIAQSILCKRNNK